MPGSASTQYMRLSTRSGSPCHRRKRDLKKQLLKMSWRVYSSPSHFPFTLLHRPLNGGVVTVFLRRLTNPRANLGIGRREDKEKGASTVAVIVLYSTVQCCSCTLTVTYTGGISVRLTISNRTRVLMGTTAFQGNKPTRGGHPAFSPTLPFPIRR